MWKLAIALTLGLAAPAAADCRFTLNFAYASAALKRADALLLHDLARAYPGATFALSSHADDDGTPAGNARVARARADTVAGRLTRAGMVQGTTLSLANAWDVVPTTGASSPLNRRVELFVAGCDPARHLEARPLDAPGVAFAGDGRVFLTRPMEPGF